MSTRALLVQATLADDERADREIEAVEREAKRALAAALREQAVGVTALIGIPPGLVGGVGQPGGNDWFPPAFALEPVQLAAQIPVSEALLRAAEELTTAAALLGARVAAAKVAAARREAVLRSNAVDIGIEWRLPNQTAQAWARRYSFRLVQWMDGNTARLIGELLARWMGDGRPLWGLEDDLIGAFFGQERAALIAVTEAGRAYARGSAEIYRAAGDVTALAFRTVRDSHVCSVCESLDGRESPVTFDEDTTGRWADPDGRVAAGFSVPVHPGCVVGGTMVAAPLIEAAFKRRYAGEVVEIATERGHRLTVTPNHPILTEQGWVAAGALQVGDHVISSRAAEAACAAVYPHNDNRPTRIEDVLEAFAGALGVTARCVPVAAEDFHGDGVDGEVEIVGADGFLHGGSEAALNKPSGELPFVGGDAGPVALPAEGLGAAFLEGGFAPAGCGVGGDGVGGVFFGRAGGHHETVGDGVATHFDSGAFQPGTNGAAVHAEVVGEGLLRFPGEVALHDLCGGHGVFGRPPLNAASGSQGRKFLRSAKQAAPGEFGFEGPVRGVIASGEAVEVAPGNVVSDRILQVNRRDFAGHVYNLQTATGWYVANGIITHNCRCRIAPVVRIPA